MEPRAVAPEVYSGRRLLLGLTAVSAQEGITISGVVTDANCAAVAGATVTIRKPANDQIQRTTTSDESQFSIRGSGLRYNFHARGLNFLIEGPI